MTSESAPPSVFVHIVTWNSATFIERCINALLSQDGYEIGKNITISVADNASKDGSAEIVSSAFAMRIALEKLSSNIGFCGGHNIGVKKFLDSGVPYLLVLNPDVRLEKDALRALVSSLEEDKDAGFGGGKLLKASSNLDPLSPPQIDSTGMILSSTLRHFDRGSGERDISQYEKREYVFGVTGAFALFKRDFVLDVVIYDRSQDERLFAVFPELRKGIKDRVQLFDEGFFAYREDADLAWRAKGTKWRCLYVPESVGFHKRVVRPENRRELSPDLNRHSVRNRFLLQLNNYSFLEDPAGFLPGIVIRNLLVLAGVFLRERSSLSGIKEAITLIPRALLIRSENQRRKRDLK